MTPDDPKPQRKSPIHLPVRWSHDTSAVVFVTVNTKMKKPILARSDVPDLLRRTWAMPGGWIVGRYVIMPEHLHFLCAPGKLEISLVRWMQFWKSHVSRRWPRPDEQPVWQSGYWDTQLRTKESYSEKWEYMQMNPVRRGLVTRPEDWPFAGKIEVLGWQ